MELPEALGSRGRWTGGWELANSPSARGTAAAGSLPAACCLPGGAGLPGTPRPGSTQHLVRCGQVAVSATDPCRCLTARHFCPCLHVPPCQQLELLVRLVQDLILPQCRQLL